MPFFDSCCLFTVKEYLGIINQIQNGECRHNILARIIHQAPPLSRVAYKK
jgi:hypothetical protein